MTGWLAMAVAATVLLATGAAGQAKPFAVRAARMVDVKRGTVVESPTLIVENGRIRSTATAAEGLCVMNLGDVTLLPGLVDAHTHLLENYESRHGGDGPNLLLTVGQMDDAHRVLLGVAMGREMLEAGFTTVRDLGNSGVTGAIALRDGIRSGWVTGPRIYAASRALAPAGGQFSRLNREAQPLIEQEYAIVNNAEDARRAVRQSVYDGADWIKVIVDGAVILSAEEMAAIVEEAHRAGKKVAAHATSDDAAKLAVEAGADSIEHGYELSASTLALMAKKKIALVPTDYLDDFYLGLYNLKPDSPADFVQQVREDVKMHVKADADRLAAAVKAGVRIVAGGDQYYNVAGKTRGQSTLGIFRAYAGAGMTPLQILRAATIDAAELVAGSKASFGSLEAGKLADVIAVAGNPLQDPTELERVTFVMKGGKVITTKLPATSCP